MKGKKAGKKKNKTKRRKKLGGRRGVGGGRISFPSRMGKKREENQ